MQVIIKSRKEFFAGATHLIDDRILVINFLTFDHESQYIRPMGPVFGRLSIITRLPVKATLTVC